MPDTNTDVRTCGGCTACCKAFTVLEVNKGHGSWCQYCNIGKGCSIYEERPKLCQEFACLWVQGLGTDEDRPDRSLIIQSNLPLDRQNRGEPILEVVETEEGELEKPYAQKLISSALARGQTVFKLPLNEFKSVLVVPHGAKLSERAERMHLSGIPIHCMSK